MIFPPFEITENPVLQNFRFAGLRPKGLVPFAKKNDPCPVTGQKPIASVKPPYYNMPSHVSPKTAEYRRYLIIPLVYRILSARSSEVIFKKSYSRRASTLPGSLCLLELSYSLRQCFFFMFRRY